ncbi:MAG: PIN domain-containing protein [Anaerolineae bacterium]
MTVLVFVDTNVLVYARDASEPDKQPQAAGWLEQLWRQQSGRLSTQVLNEYYITVTSKLRPGMTDAAARRDVRNLMRWRPLPLTGTIVERAWSLQDRHSLSYWDALIVGAAQVAGCEILLSECLQHGQQLDGVTVVNPFVQAPKAD